MHRATSRAALALALALMSSACWTTSAANVNDRDNSLRGPPPPPPPLPLRPYPWLSGHARSKKAGEDLSPDPLVAWQWDSDVNRTELQLYNVSAVGVVSSDSGSFLGLDTLVGRTEGSHVTVLGTGSIRLDFGIENGGWLEFDSPDMPDEVFKTLQVSVSETNQPYKFAPSGMLNKILQPIKYGNTYRIETPGNWEIYEGVRFAFIFVNTSVPDTPWHITGARCVSQTLPVEYTGSFDARTHDTDAKAGVRGSEDLNEMLTRVWYTAAYCPKLNMAGPPLPGPVPPSVLMLDAILMWRGDRIGWTGDDHVAQLAIMKAFGQHDFVRQSLWNTHNDSNSIESYAVYWVMSVVDYYMETNDTKTLELYVLNMDAKLQHALQIEGSATAWGRRGSWTPAKLTFFGWDERLGAGFENASCIESQQDYSMVVARACKEFASALSLANLRPDLVSRYQLAAETIKNNTRKDPNWWQHFDIHSASDAINAGIPTSDEAEQLYEKLFTNPALICSFSPFNMYWILQALGNLGRMDDAKKAIDLCWGGQIRLGATTFWETYSPGWNDILNENYAVVNSVNGQTSLCHPWSSGALQFMTEKLAGVRPRLPGYAQVNIEPALLAVRADVPTTRGVISLQINATSGQHRVRLPDAGMVAHISLPVSKAGPTSSLSSSSPPPCSGLSVVVNVDASRTHDVSLTSKNGICYAAIRLSGRSTFNIHVTAKGTPSLTTDTPPSPLAGEPMYPARVVGTDWKTQGNWQSVYGKQGYILFASGAPGSLPNKPTVCDLSGQWTSETPGKAISVTQQSGSSTFTATLNGQPWDSGTLTSNGTILFQGHWGFACATDVVDTGCDMIVWMDSPNLYWCRAGKTCSAPSLSASKLPPYVFSVTTQQKGASFQGPFDADQRALQWPNSTSHRGLGNALVNSVNDMSRDAWVDVNLNTEDEGRQNYTMWLYMCDWNAPGTATPTSALGIKRFQAVQTYDLATRRFIAPTVGIEDFDNGVWLGIQYDRSVRFRIAQVLGDNPTVSAIMFDAAGSV